VASAAGVFRGRHGVAGVDGGPVPESGECPITWPITVFRPGSLRREDTLSAGQVAEQGWRDLFPGKLTAAEETGSFVMSDKFKESLSDKIKEENETMVNHAWTPAFLDQTGYNRAIELGTQVKARSVVDYGTARGRSVIFLSQIPPGYRPNA
jgi:hypothetical protein